jgi:signal transduction histidine kinase/ligand-binding sensor domain-containing protein
MLVSAAAGLNPDRQISQYAHTAWRIQDGVFSGAPHAITQTKDGYLWIGTEAGLVRFDGVRFVPNALGNDNTLPSQRIYSLFGASDGSLWIGTNVELVLWKDHALTRFPESHGFVESILQDPAGKLWITRSQVRDGKGPLCENDGTTLSCHGNSEGIPFAYAQPLARDYAGNLWMGSSQGVARWRQDSSHVYIMESLARAEGLSGVSALAVDPRGFLWVGTRHFGHSPALQQLVDDAWKTPTLSGVDPKQLDISALMFDRDGSLWIGTSADGIYRLHDGKADRFRSTDGLSSDSVNGFYQDREGNLWVITSRGIDRFHDTQVVSYSIREGLSAESVGGVLAARDGTIWIANVGALDCLRGGKISSIGPKQGFPGRLVTVLLEDHLGRLWMGIDTALAVYENGRFRIVKRPDGSPLGVVRAIAEDTDHDIWAEVTRSAIFRIRDYAVQEEIHPPKLPQTRALAADPAGGIWMGLTKGNLARYRNGVLETFPTNQQNPYFVHNLLVESDGATWAGTVEGLVGWKNGKTQTLNTRNGLPCDDVFAMAREKNRGVLWLVTQCGFVSVRTAELDKWWADPNIHVATNVLNVFDGAQPALTNFGPLISVAPDGKIWFANDSILQMVNPSLLGKNTLVPPVHVERIFADRKAYLPRDGLHLPDRIRDLEIDYTALSFVVPERVDFRYKLEGHDLDWEQAQDRRQAFYTDLPPGPYTFRVTASNNDGVWNEAGASVVFTIAPAFFQTTWFWIACLVTGAGLLWLAYALRVRQLAVGLQARLEERLEERERIARDLHDTLLQGIFSAAIELEIAEDRMPAESEAKSLVQHALGVMRKVGKEGRNTIRSLRSRHAQGDELEEALSRVQKQFVLKKDVAFHVETEGDPRPLRPLIRDEIYSIGREAVVNAFRHSRGQRVEVEVQYGTRDLRLVVRDDGCGIDEAVLRAGREGHWGLTGMRERAGKVGANLEVMSRVGGGTEVHLSVPGKIAYETGTGSWLPERWAAWIRSKASHDNPSDDKKGEL